MTVSRKALLSMAGSATLLSACSHSGTDYARDVAQTWRPFDVARTDREALLLEVVRYATLAASSHNTQCWRFSIARDTIAIEPDFTRRCPIVDPDDHHLFVSLGCATENAVQAAAAHGLQSRVTFAEASGRIQLALDDAPIRISELYAAIPQRRSTRSAFDRQPLPARELEALAAAGHGSGVRIELIADRTRLDRIRDFVVAGNTAEVTNPAFIAELRRWIRFNDADAVQTGDGLMSSATGGPAVPGWLGRALLGVILRPKSDGDHYAKLVDDSAGIAVFVSAHDDRAHWVEAGRAYQRFALQAAALGIRTSMLNQPVEVAAIRTEFARAFALDGRPDLIARFGRGPEMPRSLRRPVRSVVTVQRPV